MNKHVEDLILKATDAENLGEIGKIQDLWSGYGAIRRYRLTGSHWKTVVVKHVHWPQNSSFPRDWIGNRSHQRKIKSYAVETAWYRQWRQHCDSHCYIPECLALEKHENEILMVLEDLNSSGYEQQRTSVSHQDMLTCLSWLAHFHATYLGQSPENLWPIGTYWHLDTRPDELEALDDIPLKNAATAIDQKLQGTAYHTFVHGDAKLANFCFSQKGDRVAAVDFQYVGAGCGMKDVAYFIGSCLYDNECERQESTLLDHYFAALSEAAKTKSPHTDITALESDWRALYPFAWTDFHRFIKGWSQGYWKRNSYSERLTKTVLEQL